MGAPDMGQPQSCLGIAGRHIGDANGYAKFGGLAPPTQYVGVNRSEIEGPFVTDGFGLQEVRVPNNSRLALSAYPEFPPPLIVQPTFGGIKKGDAPLPGPVPVSGPVHWPVKHGYQLDDGTPLNPVIQNGQVVGLTGTTADRHAYTLETSIGIPRVPNSSYPHWLVAQIRLTKDGGNQFCFGFSFCAESALAAVSAYVTDAKAGTLIVATDVLINLIGINTQDWVPGSGQPPPTPTAKLTRTLTYYKDEFSRQSLTVDGSTLDAQVRLSLDAALWPYLPDVELFGDAFAVLASETSKFLPQHPPGQPFMDAGSLRFVSPPTAAATLENQFTESIVPALAYIAATCVKSGPLTNAAQWLGGLLSSGDGRNIALKAADFFHQYLVDHQYGATLAPNNPPKPIFLTPGSSDLPWPTHKDG